MSGIEDLRVTKAKLLAMWEAYELHGLDMEGNPFRSPESVSPIAAIVAVLDAHAAVAHALSRLEEAEKALRIADVHVGWGDCTLENIHNVIRAATALSAKSRTPKPPAPEPQILTGEWPADKEKRP